MQLKRKEVLGIFKKLRMEVNFSRDVIAKFYYEGKFILATKVSHGRGDVKGDIPHFIRQQLKLNEKDFIALKNCPLTREDYVNILKRKGFIS